MNRPLFRQLRERPLVEIRVDGFVVEVPDGLSLAPALMAAGIPAWTRDPVTGGLVGPLCLMGSCFQCCAIVDGRPGQRLCRTIARPGMVIETERTGDV